MTNAVMTGILALSGTTSTATGTPPLGEDWNETRGKGVCERRENMGQKRGIILSARTFLIRARQDEAPHGTSYGTGFALGRANLVITAAHVVGEHKQIWVETNTWKPIRTEKVLRITKHPRADIAALELRENAWEGDGPKAEWWSLAVPRDSKREFPHGTEVAAWGYPHIGETEVRGRYMKGHIQAILDINEGGYRHKGYELGFPAFPQLSGAPIFLDDTLYPIAGRQHVIGMVTESVVIRETREDGDSDVRWARGLNLLEVQDWLGGIDPCLAPGQVPPT